MNIIWLEDRTEKKLEIINSLADTHVFLEAKSINEANTLWEDKKIDIIICDLNLSPEGLEENEVSATKRGLLTGWIWLENYVFNKKTSMRSKTIIFSNYISKFKKFVNKESYKDIKIISKKSINFKAEIINAINDIITS